MLIVVQAVGFLMLQFKVIESSHRNFTVGDSVDSGKILLAVRQGYAVTILPPEKI